MYGGHVIGDYTTRSVLEHALVIPQSGEIYDLVLSESLFGVSDMSEINMSRYAQAIKMSGADEVLEKLPNNIHTQIGTAYKGGTDISGGEEQRLRLAAFLFKALNPDIRFILADEPSRHLDPDTRRRVYKELINLARDLGKIVIVISHDADIEMFDRVIVIDQGVVRSDNRGEEIIKKMTLVSKQLAGDHN